MDSQGRTARLCGGNGAGGAGGGAMSMGGGLLGGGEGKGGRQQYGPRGRKGLQVLILVRGPAVRCQGIASWKGRASHSP